MKILKVIAKIFKVLLYSLALGVKKSGSVKPPFARLSNKPSLSARAFMSSASSSVINSGISLIINCKGITIYL